MTLTATIRAGEQTRQKQITVYVKRNLSDPQDCVAADLGLLTLSRISPENSERIKMSLNFAGEGLYGSEIVWSSSDPETVGQSGRVIRPKAGEADRTVQVTARVSNGGRCARKTVHIYRFGGRGVYRPAAYGRQRIFRRVGQRGKRLDGAGETGLYIS